MILQNVSVAIRLRPLSGKDRLEGCSECIQVLEGNRIMVPLNKIFSFDHTFHPQADQQEIFEKCVCQVLDNFLCGYNATILAYGQTGSGKTYTMGTGQINNSLEGEKLAIIPRSIQYIYEALTSKAEYELYASFLEIYNEEVIDLLNPSILKPLSRSILTIREDTGGNIYIAGITEEKVSSFEHLMRTNAEGDRAKESININSGLLALGNVISALGDEAKRASHVPYRDSKLTRLLQDSLGGNSQTLMIACVSPSNDDYNESLNTLRYANRARNIKNKSSLNEDLSDGSSAFEVIQLKKLVSSLKQELLDIKSNNYMKNPEKNSVDSTLYELQRRCEILEREKMSLERELEAYRTMASRNNGGDFKETIKTQAQMISELKQRLGDTKTLTLSNNNVKKYSQSEYLIQSPTKKATNSPSNIWSNNVKNFVTSVKQKLANRFNIVKSINDLGIIKEDYVEEDDTQNISLKIASQVEELIAPIRTDLALKADLLQHIEQGQREYQLLRQKYEERISLVQKSLTQAQTERDEALGKLIQFNGKVMGEPNRYSRQKYEDRIKNLVKENKELKEGLDSLNRNSSGKNLNNENIIRNLRSGLVTLKEEKAKLQQMVDKEMYKLKSSASTVDNEITELRSKERKALEMAKKWKKAYDFEKTLLQRRVEQFIAAKAKIRSLLNVMRKKHLSLGSPSVGIDFNSPNWQKINSSGDSKSNSPLLNRTTCVKPSPLYTNNILSQLKNAASLAQNEELSMMDIDD